jgi:hypothetical protein
MPLEGEKRPFGESRRWGDRRDDLSIKPLESGRADRLRQKESRWNGALEVAADPGLTLSRSGERAMIGGATGDGWGSSLWRVQVCRCAATISRQQRWRCKDGRGCEEQSGQPGSTNSRHGEQVLSEIERAASSEYIDSEFRLR